MRLTGPSDFAIRTVRTAGANAPDRVGTPVPAKSVRADDGIGVATGFAKAGPTPMFDAERVAQIRKAIEQDRYPLVPAKIADAIIAAKLYGIVGS